MIFRASLFALLVLGTAAGIPSVLHAQAMHGARAQVATRSLPPGDQATLDTALRSYESGDLTTARPLLLRLAAKYPNHEETQAAAGMTLAEAGEVQQAVPYLRRAHRLAPGDLQVKTNLAVALLKTGGAAEAVTLFQAVAAQMPNDAGVRVSLAQAESESGQHAAAAASYAVAARLLEAKGQPVDDDLRHDWAVALLGAKQPDRAADVLSKAADQANSAVLQALLGEAAEQQKQYQAAAEHYKRAAQLDPSESNLYSYANELMQHWTFPAAVEVLTFARRRYPESTRLGTALGVAFYGNGDYAKAVPIFAGLLAREPNSAPLADLLGRNCSALGGAEQQGCATLQSFAEAHPANAPASLYAAETILHRAADKQDTGAATRLLRNALRVDPKLPEAWYQLAVVQQSAGDWAGSADLLQHALQQRPDYPEAHYRLSRAYAHLGRRDEAQKEVALQQKYAGDLKAEEQRRMQEVTTFLVQAN